MGRIKQSLDVFKEAENMINRSDHEIYHFIGEILLKNKEFHRKHYNNSNHQNEINEAKKYLQNAVMHGKKLESYQKLANIYEMEKDYNKAIDILESCLQ